MHPPLNLAGSFGEHNNLKVWMGTFTLNYKKGSPEITAMHITKSTKIKVHI